MSRDTSSTHSHLLARLGILFLLPVGTLIILLMGISPPSLSPPTISAAPLAVPELDLDGTAPVVTYTTTFVEDGGAVDITNSPVVTDADGTLASATVTITNRLDGADEVLTATGTTTITVNYNTGVLSLTGPDTITNYESVLSTVAYSNTSQNPDTSDRIVHFVVNDGSDDSEIVTSTVHVTALNDPPELVDLNGAAPGITFTTTFTEDEGAVLITSSPVVTDLDSTHLNRVEVQIVNDLDLPEETLSATGNGTITVSFDRGNGRLTMRNSDTIANYTSVLSTVTYNNTSQNPDTSDRTISFRVRDNSDAWSDYVNSTVKIVSVNDAPTANAVATTVCLSNTGTLDGSGSHDHPVENHPLTYKWEQTGGPAAPPSNDTLSITTFTAPGAPTVLTFTLTITDVPGSGLTPLTDTAQVSVTVADVNVAGLAAANSSRSMLGQKTVFTATTTAGCSVEYTWGFGDGVTGTGWTVNHTYAKTGRYTAIVTAANSLGNLVTATTRVTITSYTGSYYVPPNHNYESRDPGLLVTAVQDGTSVDIVDDDADGDDDDTFMDIELDKGESFVVYIQNGAVNDDEWGPQATQGDYFRISSHKPVIVCNFTANSNWEHEFIPATNNNRVGTDFYFYVDVSTPQIDPIAFSDDTLVKLIDVTDSSPASKATGKASATSDVSGTLIFTATLNAGEDLWEMYAPPANLSDRHTYHLIANKRIALQYGAPLGYASNAQRDGGTYVPSKRGRLTGRTFYFGIPYCYPSERELRIATYDDGADVSVRAWDTVSSTWADVHSTHLGPHGHLDLIGDDLSDSSGTGYYFFEVLATADVSVFETNWFETGNYGTSDIATYVSPEAGSFGQRFIAYLGPPANEPDLEDGVGNVQLTHLYVFAREETDVVAYDSDAYGEWIELYNTTTETVDLSDWTLTNGDGASVVLPDGTTILSQSYYLLEYHEKATEEPADFVYGDLYPYFKLGNGEDTLTLQGILTGSTSFNDSFSYTETWGSHGVHAALARITPTNQADDGNNWADATNWHADDDPNNLDDFWGTPGAQNDGYSGDGNGPQQGVVINEFMSGRLWHPFTIPDGGGYHDIALTTTEWEALYNGDRPNSSSGDPEGPYVIVESTKYVNVMNTNWNDNWMAYATRSAPDPSITYLPSHYQRSPGEAVRFTADVWTDKTVLYNPVTTIEIPAEMDYTPGSYISPTELLATATVTETHNADGSWTISWDHGVEMTTTVSYQFVITAIVPSSAVSGTWLRSVAGTVGTSDPDPLISTWYSVQDVANVVVGPDEVREEELVINEVMVNPGAGGHEWIELFNAGTTPIVLTGKVLSATGQVSDTVAFSYTIPQFVLDPDSYVVIHLTDGISTTTDLYAGSGTAGLNDTEGSVSLFAVARFAGNTLIDFVQWDNDGNLSHTAADDMAAAADQWTDGEYITSTLPGNTLGRDRYSSDTNDADDWENTGGIHSGVPTPGAVNWTHPGLNLIKIADPVVIYPGGNVLYTYQVRNSGEESLSNVSVNDDTCSPLTFASGDTDSNNELDRGETWLYTCSTRLYKDTTNHAHAEGTTTGTSPAGVSDDATASVIVTTGPINHRPEPQNDYVCTHRGVRAVRPIDVLANDTDPDGDSLEVIAVGTPHTGTVTYTVDSVIYTPPNDTFTGTVVFTYTVIDDSRYLPGPLTATAKITVLVKKNEPPVAVDDIVHVVMGSPRVIYVLENDYDPDIPCTLDYLTVISVGQPLTGTITWNDTTVTYYPPDNYTGTVPFTVTFPYTISDNALGVTGPLTDSAWIFITVVYPVGGYTEPMSVPLWPWVMLVPLVSIVVVVAVALRRRTAGHEFP